MNRAETPMPGEDPGALPDAKHDGAPDPESEMTVEANPQPEPDSSVPTDDVSDTDDSGQQPS